MNNTQINKLLAPAIKWAKSCGASHFEQSFKNSPQYANFVKTGTLKLVIFGKSFYWKDYYFVKKVENGCGPNHIITELMDMDGKIIGGYIETDLPIMNNKI